MNEGMKVVVYRARKFEGCLIGWITDAVALQGVKTRAAWVGSSLHTAGWLHWATTALAREHEHAFDLLLNGNHIH